jgi:hypothetical protein
MEPSVKQSTFSGKSLCRWRAEKKIMPGIANIQGAESTAEQAMFAGSRLTCAFLTA